MRQLEIQDQQFGPGTNTIKHNFLNTLQAKSARIADFWYTHNIQASQFHNA